MKWMNENKQGLRSERNWLGISLVHLAISTNAKSLACTTWVWFIATCSAKDQRMNSPRMNISSRTVAGCSNDDKKWREASLLNFQFQVLKENVAYTHLSSTALPLRLSCRMRKGCNFSRLAFPKCVWRHNPDSLLLFRNVCCAWRTRSGRTNR